MTGAALREPAVTAADPWHSLGMSPPPVAASASRSASDGGQLGALLKAARAARGISQLELALRLGISQRHLGFVEVGRSRPSRGMLLSILDELSPPWSVRNATLLAAGWPADPVAAARVPAEFSRSLRAMLDAHNPWPGIIFDADWICRAMTPGAVRLCGLLMPASRAAAARGVEFDMIDAVADPEGMLRYAVGPEVAAASLLSQFWTESLVRPSLAPRVRACAEALEARYGTLPGLPRDPGTPHLSLLYDTPAGRLSFQTFQCVPGLPMDVSTASLRVELWYPDDGFTRDLLETATGEPSPADTPRAAHGL